MLVHERGSLGPKLQGSHGTGPHPQHCQHHPQDADDAGEWGVEGAGGGGVTWPRDWYIYIVQGFLNIPDPQNAHGQRSPVVVKVIFLGGFPNGHLIM